MKHVAIFVYFLLLLAAGTANLQVCGHAVPTLEEVTLSASQTLTDDASFPSVFLLDEKREVTSPCDSWPIFFDVDTENGMLSFVGRFSRTQVNPTYVQRTSTSFRHILYRMSLLNAPLISLRCERYNHIFSHLPKSHRSYYVYALRHIVI